MSMFPETISSVTKKETSQSRSWFFRVFRLCLDLSVASIAGTLAWRNYTKVDSRQAFVNAEIVDVRNPIAGNLLLKNIQPGQWLSAGTAIGRVENLLQASELEVKQQELKSKLQINQQQLLGIKQKIADQRQLMSQFAKEVDEQQKLGVILAQQQIEEANSQLEQAKFQAQVAKSDVERSSTLLREGAITATIAEKDVSEFNQALAAVKSAESRLAQAHQRFKATEVGLQLDGSRTLNYSEIRMRELQSEIADLQRQASELPVQAQTMKIELLKIIQQLKLNQLVVITAPTTGAVWSVDAKAGEFINATTPILKVLNCQNRWVDAFFSEASTSDLSPGMPVQVRLLGSNSQVLEGTIEAIRGGSGRVSTGQDVAVPPPDSARRQVAVRVKVDWPEAPNSVQFCDVGRSAEVVLPKPSPWRISNGT